jgi:tRNA A-37 threonylcarbamoyl transferase component Bud32
MTILWRFSTLKNLRICVINSIRQIFGYMAHNKRRYGILSTYDRTWFLLRPNNDPAALFISDVVKCEDQRPTLLRCFAYIMSLARQDSGCPSPPRSPLRTLEDNESPEEKDDDEDSTYQPPKGSSSGSGRGGHGSGRGNAGSRGGSSNTRKRNPRNTRGKRGAPDNKQLNRELKLEKFDWDSFEMADVLGEGRCGKVFEGTLRGERVAIKLCDLWQHPELHDEMLREAGVYVELGKLQGRGIPELKGVGYTAGGLFALMTEFGGSPMEVENLNDQKRRMIKGVLASIHGEGYLHGDLRSDNILVEDCHGGPRVKIIDFGFSRKFSSRKESEREMAVLKKLISTPRFSAIEGALYWFLQNGSDYRALVIHSDSTSAIRGQDIQAPARDRNTRSASNGGCRTSGS